ncbi:MAG: hypothetical protein ACREIV_12150, partial [Planctomycetaceae bacterium]
ALDFAHWLKLLIETEQQVAEAEQQLKQAADDSAAQEARQELDELRKIQTLQQEQLDRLEVRNVNTGRLDRLARDLVENDVDVEEMLYPEDAEIAQETAKFRGRLEELYKQHNEELTYELGQIVVEFPGLLYLGPFEDDPVLDQEFTYDLWETLDVGGRYLLPTYRLLVRKTRLIEQDPGRGGDFAKWLVEHVHQPESPAELYLAWQASPPPLNMEGRKVQTPWLYQFLKDPYQIRHTTVLRMPKFNFDEGDVQALANYFAAKSGAAYPYQDVPQRDPPYLAEMSEEFREILGDEPYLEESWDLLTGNLCIKCHSVAGRPAQLTETPGGPKPVRAPNLNQVSDRLRPDYLQLWMFKPSWTLPYTSMPRNFPRGQVVVPDVFEGNSHAQNYGARDSLLNYHRLMETQN